MPAPAPPKSDAVPQDQPIEGLLPALLLAATGGMLDAIVYLLHGHVFANAMSGNVVLLGLNLLDHRPHDVARHAAPILAFLLGVMAAKAVRRRPATAAILAALALEALVLGVLGALPLRLPQMLFTTTIAFVSAFQVSSFRRVHRFSFNSTFVTGNLREMAEGVYLYLTGAPDERAEAALKARDMASICTCFLAGAVTGAAAAARIGDRTLWIGIPLLAGVGLHVWLHRSDRKDP